MEEAEEKYTEKPDTSKELSREETIAAITFVEEQKIEAIQMINNGV